MDRGLKAHNRTLVAVVSFAGKFRGWGERRANGARGSDRLWSSRYVTCKLACRLLRGLGS